MTKELEQAERLAKVEKSVEFIERTVTNINSKLDTWQANYTPRPELIEMFKSRDIRIEELEKKSEKQDSHIIWLWRTSGGAFISAFAAGLIALFFWIAKGGKP